MELLELPQTEHTLVASFDAVPAWVIHRKSDVLVLPRCMNSSTIYTGSSFMVVAVLLLATGRWVEMPAPG